MHHRQHDKAVSDLDPELPSALMESAKDFLDISTDSDASVGRQAIQSIYANVEKQMLQAITSKSIAPIDLQSSDAATQADTHKPSTHTVQNRASQIADTTKRLSQLPALASALGTNPVPPPEIQTDSTPQDRDTSTTSLEDIVRVHREKLETLAADAKHENASALVSITAFDRIRSSSNQQRGTDLKLADDGAIQDQLARDLRQTARRMSSDLLDAVREISPKRVTMESDPQLTTAAAAPPVELSSASLRTIFVQTQPVSSVPCSHSDVDLVASPIEVDEPYDPTPLANQLKQSARRVSDSLNDVVAALSPLGGKFPRLPSVKGILDGAIIAQLNTLQARLHIVSTSMRLFKQISLELRRIQ
eukprot:jgi/Hompol1/6271/HPOL_004915-RA